jgi:hypothetical protein
LKRSVGPNTDMRSLDAFIENSLLLAGAKRWIGCSACMK